LIPPQAPVTRNACAIFLQTLAPSPSPSPSPPTSKAPRLRARLNLSISMHPRVEKLSPGPYYI
ncbi:hypothetical protein BAE44_0014369, partial [Dichanthelium oligosanthes]